MPSQQGNFINVIDVGSAKTCALVAEITEGGLRYRGHGVAESRGSRKGVIVDLEKAVASIQKAVERAEDTAGAPVEHALVGVAGARARGKSRVRRSSWRSTRRAAFRCPLIGKFFTCFRRNLFWMSNPACTIRWG